MKPALRMVLLASILFSAVWYGWSMPLSISLKYWPVELVSVEGRLSAGEKQQIRKAIAGHLNNGFILLNLNDVVDSVMELSWSRAVEVRRQWPGNILLSVKKQSIVARWNDSEYLSTSGQVVSGPDGLGEELPRLYAEHSDGIRTMGIYGDLNRVVQSTDTSGKLKIIELHEDAQGSWQLKFESGLTVTLGREALNARLTRFVSVYNHSLYPKEEQLLSVDARYRNGVAVKWVKPLLKGELLTLATQQMTGNGRR